MVLLLVTVTESYAIIGMNSEYSYQNLCLTNILVQEKCESEKQEIKNSCPPKQQVVKNRSKKNEKKCKVEKKRVSPVSWPHLKLLGC